MTSVLNRPMIDSARALSYESPRLPTDGAMPESASRSVYRMDTYCVPRAPVQDEISNQGRGDQPADDPAGKHVNDERDVDEAAPRRDVRVSRPEPCSPSHSQNRTRYGSGCGFGLNHASASFFRLFAAQFGIRRQQVFRTAVVRLREDKRLQLAGTLASTRSWSGTA
jgi:hypothetical protein